MVVKKCVGQEGVGAGAAGGTCQGQGARPGQGSGGGRHDVWVAGGQVG